MTTLKYNSKTELYFCEDCGGKTFTVEPMGSDPVLTCTDCGSHIWIKKFMKSR